MTGYSNGASLAASVGNSLGQGIAAGPETGVRWPVPWWRFGISASADRGCMEHPRPAARPARIRSCLRSVS